MLVPRKKKKVSLNIGAKFFPKDLNFSHFFYLTRILYLVVNKLVLSNLPRRLKGVQLSQHFLIDQNWFFPHLRTF